jgi:hypothetical protein
MNCTTCQLELSQCLDGRLPSGRRTAVLQHARACPDCGRFWAELQAAKQLVARIAPIRVSDTFKDGLWERIRSGEGTPDNVFHEPITLLTKARYALTGAAAAAAVLLVMLWVGERDDAPHGQSDGGGTEIARAEQTGPRGQQPQANQAAVTPGGDRLVERYVPASVHDNPLLSSTQRLTFDLVAVETAKQLEQRYAAAKAAMRVLADDAQGEGRARDASIRRAIDNAADFRAFGELLLDLRDRRRLFFTDAETDADLRFAVNMLGDERIADCNLRTVQAVLAPALRSSRLGSVSRTISLVPTLDPREETEVLMRLNLQRPEVFPKLFFVLGSNPNAGADGHPFAPLPPGTVFVMPDACGPSWVAPRSEVESRDGLLRLLRQHVDGGGTIEFEVRARAR